MKVYNQSREKRRYRTPLAERVLPVYTRGEELFNTLTHLAGVIFGLFALPNALALALGRADPVMIAATLVWTLSIVGMYAISAFYHALSPCMGKRVLQVVDHCFVFVLIAGTYTPVSLCTLRAFSPSLGWGYLVFVWGVALVGITLNAIDLHRFSVFSNLSYLLLGWCILPYIGIARAGMGERGFALLLWGGAAYTLGAAAYLLGVKVRYMHGVFHLLTLVGTVLHYASIVGYVLVV